MEIHDEKNHLYNIIIFFSMLLFAVCLTMNVIFGSNYYPYESLDNTIIYKTWTISNNITVNEDSDNVTYSKSLFLNNNNSYTETIIKNICPVPIIAVISKGFSLLLIPIIIFLFFFLNLFILLSDRWTLVNQKIRLDIWINSFSNHCKSNSDYKPFLESNNGFLFVCKYVVCINLIPNLWEWNKTEIELEEYEWKKNYTNYFSHY